jgi:uncharacterized lipoprotein
MKKNIIAGFAAILLLASCKDDKKVLDSLADYNNSMMEKGYHFGDKLYLPKDVTMMQKPFQSVLEIKKHQVLP